MGEQFKVGDRARVKHTPSVEWTVVTLTDSSQHVVIRKADDEWIIANVQDLERVDPDPIAPYRKPANGPNGPKDGEIVEMGGKLYRAHREGSETKFEPIEDPIAAAKAKCAETAERAAKMLGESPLVDHELTAEQVLAMVDFPDIETYGKLRAVPPPLPEHRPTYACDFCRRATEHADSQAGMRCVKCSALCLGIQRTAITAPREPTPRRKVDTLSDLPPEVRGPLADKLQDLKDSNTRLEAQNARLLLKVAQLERKVRR